VCHTHKGDRHHANCEPGNNHLSHANPFLVGNFAPVTVETTAFDLPVRGTIPEELEGRLLRIGPNTEVHNYGPACASLEPVFVARQGGTGGDDGWILSFVYNGE
jgi:carotenoid cleavage dioxygenase-like enzyme